MTSQPANPKPPLERITVTISAKHIEEPKPDMRYCAIETDQGKFTCWHSHVYEKWAVGDVLTLAYRTNEKGFRNVESSTIGTKPAPGAGGPGPAEVNVISTKDLTIMAEVALGKSVEYHAITEQSDQVTIIRTAYKFFHGLKRMVDGTYSQYLKEGNGDEPGKEASTPEQFR